MASNSTDTEGVPNPYLPANFYMEGEILVNNSKRHIRNAHILAGVRKLIAEQGLLDFSIQSLSKKVDVSPQSIYNNFGTKDRLIASAINDYSFAIYQYSHTLKDSGNKILSYVESLSSSCEIYPQFLSKATSVVYFHRQGPPIFKHTHSYCVTMIYRELLNSQSDFTPNGRADLRQVAELISTLIGGALLGWSRGEYVTSTLRGRLAFRTDLLLRGLCALQPDDRQVA